MTITIALVVASTLTVGMFITREMMLGFICTISWVIAGAINIQASATSTDIEFISGWAFCLIGAILGIASYGLRKKDLDEPDADNEGFIDEQEDNPLIGDNKAGETESIDDIFSLESKTPPTRVQQRLHDRTSQRRQSLNDRAMQRRNRRV